MCAHEMKGRKRVFVFVDVAPKKEKGVLEKLLEFDEVIEVHAITGQYDVLAVLEIELRGFGILASAQELADKSIQKIRKLSGVRDTNTIIPISSVTKRIQ